MSQCLADQRKVTEIILETERVADRILANKQKLVELDKRRQETREALRVIEKHFPLRRIWISIGSMLVKQDRQGAVDLLRKDQQTTEADIERIRGEQKLLVTKQRDLEHERPLRGFNLKPLSTAEIAGIRSNLPGF
uniref:p53 and DNA damage-regulated protein 1 n=1 Tax=Anopheles atroparvus TaxID=41427 RepID=A0AAG5CSG8_ANOAO